MTFRGFGTVPAGPFGLRGFERSSSACYFTQYEMPHFTRFFCSGRELILRSTHKTLISSSRNCKTSRPATVSPYRKRNSFFLSIVHKRPNRIIPANYAVTDSRLCVNLSQLYQDVEVVDTMLETIQDTVLKFQVSLLCCWYGLQRPCTCCYLCMDRTSTKYKSHH